MIIFLNLFTGFSFLIKGILHKNEFSLVKTILKKIKNIYLINFKSNYKPITFKKFIRLYSALKVILLNKHLKLNFREYTYLLYIININNVNINTLKSIFKKSNINVNTKTFKLIDSKLNTFLKNNKLSKSDLFTKNFTSKYSINYKPSSFVKYSNNNSLSIYFLRKNKIFNKGRYSRNRQLYRTGVYWCIWLSVFLGYCLYFSFYRFTFNFGYQWWLIFGFLFLFVNQKMFKYNFYNFKVVILEVKKNFNWVALFSYNVYKSILNLK